MHPLLNIDQYREADHSIIESWEKFMHSGVQDVHLRSIVSNSWQRCQQLELPLGIRQAPKQLSQQGLQQVREANQLLLAVATPIMKKLCEQFRTNGLTMVLTDNDGTILQEEATTDTLREFDKLNFTVGAVWSEAFCGTNAIGTALATHIPVTIFSAEHYCEGWHHLVCSAIPVNDPFTQKQLGIIDLTGRKELLGSHNAPVVYAVKAQVEQALEHAFLSRLFNNAYQSLFQEKEPVIVFNTAGKITRFNKLAQQLFGVREGSNFRAKFKLPESSTLNKHVKVTLQYTEDSKCWEITINAHLIGQLVSGGIAIFRPLEEIKTRKTEKLSASVISQSAAFKNCLADAANAARFDFPVLISGSSGVGKERVAQYIYEHSPRNLQPFVPVNCGAIPRELIGSELFGYVPGAFTGSGNKEKKGKFLLADKGVLFLDEIGELPLEVQPYLLRILEEKMVYPLGSDKGIPIDVRIVAATHKDLEAEVAKGSFREDLFYRLNVINLQIPDLKYRLDDILPLFTYFLGRYITYPIHIHAEAQKRLLQYPWPGNVRELKNAAEFATFALREEVQLTVGHLPLRIATYEAGHADPGQLSGSGAGASLSERQQYILIQHAIQQAGGNLSKAALAMNISRMTLYRKLKRMKNKG